jgi:hypothetical protein
MTISATPSGGIATGVGDGRQASARERGMRHFVARRAVFVAGRRPRRRMVQLGRLQLTPEKAAG